MTREQFIQRRKNDWTRFEVLLSKAEASSRPKLSGEEISEFSSLYRSLCFDLSLVQSRDWGVTVSRYLNDLAVRGHNYFYRSKPGSLQAVLHFVTTEFPQLFRQNIGYFWFALALSVLPGLVAGGLIAYDINWTSRIVSSDQQAMFERMYSSEVSRNEDADALMAGFYVHNNIGIAFRCFSSGVFAGLGTIFLLVYNSIFLGAVTSFLTVKGHGDRFFPFVIGHGAFELTAIVISGMAGLILGRAVVHSGEFTRWDNLRRRGLVAVKIALGAGLMLAVAALIEGFWSPLKIPSIIKYVVGTFLWVVVFLYLTFAGRTKHAA